MGVLLALAGAAVLVDLVRFRFGVDGIGLVNLVVVWVAIHQLGYLYADGRLVRWAPWMAGGGLIVVVVLTGSGRYPVSMAGIPMTLPIALSLLGVGVILDRTNTRPQPASPPVSTPSDLGSRSGVR